MQSSHNLRSHHSLKNSTINQTATNQHMNPLSSRPSLARKISLNYKGDISCTTPTPRNQIHYENNNNNQVKQSYLTNGYITKNQPYIMLGNKVRDTTHERTNSNEFQNKIDMVFSELDKQNKRLNCIEAKLFTPGFKDEIVFKTNMSLNQPYQLKNQINNLRVQLNKVTQKRQMQKRVQSCQLFIRQTALSLQNTLNLQINRVDTKIQKMVRRQIQKINDQFQIKLQQFSQRVSEYIGSHTNNKPDYCYEAGKFTQKFIPLFKNPSIRLKFMGKVSLIQAINKNPENQTQNQQWPVEQYSQTYLLDKDGFLLDEKQRYLTNQQGQCIQLTNDQVKILLGMKMFSLSQ